LKVKPGHQKYKTPVEVGTAYDVNTNSDKSSDQSVDEQIDSYLVNRRKRLLDEAKLAELEHTTEDEKTQAARSRKERELLQEGKISPIDKEDDMGDTEKKIKDAADVAAQAASVGVDPGEATSLGIGKSRVVVIMPGGGDDETREGKGGWSVLNAKPIRDPEGEYTFSQALKVAQLEVPRIPSDNKKSLGEELADAKQKLEAIGIKVGAPVVSPPRSLKDEVAEAVELLRALGIHVGTSQQAPLKEQVTEAKSLLEGLGLSIGTQGESLESIREKHHHEERMDEIKADREHKARLADVADDMSERVGHGIADEMRHGHAGVKPGGSNLPTVHCDDCNIDFPVSPEATTATCPKCGTAYKRNGQAPAES